MIKKGIVVALCTILILFGIKYGLQYYNDNYSKMSSVSSKEVSSIEELKEIIDNNDKVYVYVGRPNCSDSDEFEEYFVPYMKDNNIDNLVYFNIKDIVEEHEMNNEYKEILDEEFNVRNTPTLAVYKDGQLTLKSEWTTADGYNEEMAMDFVEESGLND